MDKLDAYSFVDNNYEVTVTASHYPNSNNINQVSLIANDYNVSKVNITTLNRSGFEALQQILNEIRKPEETLPNAERERLRKLLEYSCNMLESIQGQELIDSNSEQGKELDKLIRDIWEYFM